MGSKFKKALIAENVRGSLHGWVKRVKDRSKHNGRPLSLISTRSEASLQSIADETEEKDTPWVTIAGAESRSSFEQSNLVISIEVDEQIESESTSEELCCSIPNNDHPSDGGSNSSNSCRGEGDGGSSSNSCRPEGDGDCNDQVKDEQ